MQVDDNGLDNSIIGDQRSFQLLEFALIHKNKVQDLQLFKSTIESLTHFMNVFVLQ